MFRVILCLLVVFAGGLVADEAVEVQAKQLEKEVLAPCCWFNTLSEHHSEIAEQLKRKIRFLLAEGKSPETVKDLLAQEYGERILAKPRARGGAIIIWLLPPLVLLLTIYLVWRYLRRPRQGQPVDDTAATSQRERALAASEVEQWMKNGEA